MPFHIHSSQATAEKTEKMKRTNTTRTLAALCGLVLTAAQALCAPANITNITPSSSPVGTILTINGTNLNRRLVDSPWQGSPPYVLQFKNGSGIYTSTPFTYINSSTLRVTVPSWATSGQVRIKESFLVDYSTNSWTRVNPGLPPNITTITPATSPTGTQLTISGTNLNLNRSGLPWSGVPSYQLQFKQSNGTYASTPFTYLGATSLRVTVPTWAQTGQPRIVESPHAALSPPTWPRQANAVTKLRFQNNSQYYVVDLRIDGIQKIGTGQGIAPQSFAEFEVTSGTRSVQAGNGFWNGSSRDIWFTNGGNVNCVSGQTSTFTWARTTIPQLLTGFGASEDWVGTYFTNNGNLGIAKFRVFANGTYQLYDNNVLIQSGSVIETSWPNHAAMVKFRFGNSQEANCSFPFGRFFLRNGPASWPIIEYVRQ